MIKTFDDSAIKIKELVKEFHKKVILDNLNLEIKRNSITTILGFSGAGKSTLMKILLGLVKPTRGSIEILGESIFDLSKYEIKEFRRNFGMVFQYAALFDSLTTEDNISFPMREFTKMSESEISQHCSKLLGLVGLEEDSKTKLPSQLSGGMRKRVGLARALALEPKIILYDEPTTGLDPITTKIVNDLILGTAKKANQDGRELTSLIISHDIRATLGISDYVAFLDRGRIIEYLPVREFKNSQDKLVRNFLELTIF